MPLLFLLAIQKLLYSLALAIFLTEFTALLVTFLFLISELNRSQYLIIDVLRSSHTKDYPLTLLSKYHSDKRGYLFVFRLAFSFNLGQFILDFIRQRLMRFPLPQADTSATVPRPLEESLSPRAMNACMNMSNISAKRFSAVFSKRVLAAGHLLANLFTYILGGVSAFCIYIRLTLIQSLITFLQFLVLSAN